MQYSTKACRQSAYKSLRFIKRQPIIGPILTSLFGLACRSLSDKLLIRLKYFHKLGKWPNLDCPSLFTEKIQKLKLAGASDLKTQCADKLNVRRYVEETIGAEYLIPLVFSTDAPEEINEKTLPDFPVIVKPTHDSGGGYIIAEKNRYDFKALHEKLWNRLNKNYFYGNRESEYKQIKPMIVVEKLLTENDNDLLLNDYKIYCFDGVPHYIQTIFDRQTNVKETWFDTNWQIQDVWYFSPERKSIDRPNLLEEMVSVAKKLAKPFPYVRVDLYIHRNKIFFGELTFSPYGGFMKWHPPTWDKKLGDLLKLPD